METCAFDMNSDYLVTDLVHELSSGLEIPFLLSDDINAVKNQDNGVTDNLFYDKYLKEEWSNDQCLNIFDNKKSSNLIKNETSDHIQSCLEKNKIIKTHFKNEVLDFPENGCISDCMSTEIFLIKNELDTPPITPPDERKSPDIMLQLNTNEINFVPINPDGNICGDLKSCKITSFDTAKKIKIQPKPVTSALNIFEPNSEKVHTVMCNVFSDINSNNLTSSKINLLNPKNMFGSYNQTNKSVLPKKDLELLQAKKKQERMIRNRESAYLSRKRKKEHVANLEKQVQDLLIENNHLRLENLNLKKRLAKYEVIESSSLTKKPQNFLSDSSKKTTAVLALLLTVCFNIGSLSSFLNEEKIKFEKSNIVKSNLLSVNINGIRHSRSLLWANPDFESFNSSLSNFTKTSCPLFINQSESIRLESELRKWIGDEDYYSSSSKNISKISQYFYSGEKPSRHNSVRKRKNKKRFRYSHHDKMNLEMNMYQMKTNSLNFDTLFEAIHRRDDTFYLVSFSSDHLLLPALSHNKTSRPKMSLMLPAFLSNGTLADQVEMMQIDCEVTNTQLLSVHENNIPLHMRRYSNSSSNLKNSTMNKSDKFEFIDGSFKRNLVSKGNNFFNQGNINVSKNYMVPLSREKNQSIHNDIKEANFQENKYNYNMTTKMKTGINKFSNSSYNQTPKKIQSTNELISDRGKNLLKILMVRAVASYNNSPKKTNQSV